MGESSLIRVFVANRIDVAGEAPTRVQILPWGSFETHLGEGRTRDSLVDEEAFRLMQIALDALPSELMFDYEHQSEDGGDPDGLSRAAGWLKSIEMVPGVGVFATVDWTPRAASLIGGKEYRYLSPAGYIRKSDGRWVELTSIALTNKPFLSLQPIVNNRTGAIPTEGDDQMKGIRKALGLPETADESACVEAINSIKSVRDQYKVLRKAVCSVAELDVEKAADDDVVKAANSLAPKREDVDTSNAELDQVRNALKRTNETLATTQAELETLQSRNAERDAEERIAKALNSGKLTPAMVEVGDDGSNFYRNLAKDKEAWCAWEATAPQVMPPEGTPAANARKSSGNSDRQSVINRARTEYESEESLQSLCSVEGYVEDQLRDAGLKASLTDDEKQKLSV